MVRQRQRQSGQGQGKVDAIKKTGCAVLRMRVSRGLICWQRRMRRSRVRANRQQQAVTRRLQRSKAMRYRRKARQHQGQHDPAADELSTDVRTHAPILTDRLKRKVRAHAPAIDQTCGRLTHARPYPIFEFK